MICEFCLSIFFNAFCHLFSNFSFNPLVDYSFLLVDNDVILLTANEIFLHLHVHVTLTWLLTM